MGQKTAMWVHGTSVHEEYPDIVQSFRKGWGSHFVGDYGTKNWFHFSITTPALLNGVRPSLVKVFVFYNTNPREQYGFQVHARITNLHIYDGKMRVKAFDGLDLTGDHSHTIDDKNSWVIEPNLTIRYGLGLSLGVEYPIYYPEMGNARGEILFTTAGADFEV